MGSIIQHRCGPSFIESIYENYKRPLLRIIYKHIGDYDACEDVLHEVFIRIIKDAETLSSFPKEKIEAYIYLIARWVSIDYLRRVYKERQINVDVDDTLLNSLISSNQTATKSFNPINKIDLKLLLSELSAEEQLLLIGKYYLNLSTEELINIVGGTSIGLRSKIHRAKKRVFNSWIQAGLHMEDFFNEEF